MIRNCILEWNTCVVRRRGRTKKEWESKSKVLFHHFNQLFFTNSTPILPPISTKFPLQFLRFSLEETQWYAYLRMSFQDLESGRRNLINGKQDPTQAVASGVFQINTAVSTFQRLVNTLGTPKDTPELREKLWEITAPLSSSSLNWKFCWLLQF